MGTNVFSGKDYTIHAGKNGVVKYYKGKKGKTFVSVLEVKE